MTVSTSDLLAQADDLARVYLDMRGRSRHDDLSDLPIESNTLVVRLRAAIERFASGTTSYMRELSGADGQPVHKRLPIYLGILAAVRADVQSGWIQSVAELLHANTFSDLLDQAAELTDKGYKDTSAVITGSALEAHLRLLADKSGVTTQVGTQPKKADVINADLVKAGAYNTIQQKAVTGWLGLRNAAAHGEYAKYTHAQVAGMVDSVRDFIVRHPA